MDYSLLLGVYYAKEDDEVPEDLDRPNRVFTGLKKSRWMQTYGGAAGVNEETGVKEIYYLGIIDVLIKYRARKKMENLWKGVVYKVI